MILWDDIETVDFTNAKIQLSKATTKLNTLHPSDLADIIEELDKTTRASIFAMLDEEKAADVLEELEPHAQIHIVESLPIEKVADVLEKMPADEAADLLDVLKEEKAEKLLREMEKESSEEIRELLEYPDKAIGSIMSTDFISFPESKIVQDALDEIRNLKPDPSNIYSIFVTNKKDQLISAISLMELVIADPKKKLKEIMNRNLISVFDDDDVDSLAELVSKYNLLAVPVVNKQMKMEGVVVIEDIVEDLLNRRKTK
jgi:Mg/Co/Ni transporter MgtE